ncbi:MAG TPA: PQQ-dependent sugar dehydrogenase [Thermoleophilaceae bacterium]|nr:PQQ-dependent sugar dehydrogenase [Thermoleophilaceae bacterium]
MFAVALAWPATAGALTTVKVGGFFPSPTYVTAPPGDAHRLFVVEKGGRIDVLHDAARRRFLDVAPLVDSTGEKGLFSMAFAPDYTRSGRLYVYYAAPRADDPVGDVLTVAEYRRSATHPDRADPATPRVLFTVDNPSGGDPAAGNHNGGQLQFGPDGLLYAATGDGGAPNDPGDDAQNPASLLGKVLRIDPRATGAKPEVYASGLRNPWRFSFDRATGDLVLADVGEHEWEEIDVAPHGTPAGTNYGWDCREAFVAAPGTCAPGPLTDPVFAYPHPEEGCSSVTGGYVVRDRGLGSLYGRYLYTDYCGGDVRSLALADPAGTDSTTGLVQKSVVSFGEDSCGHVYLVKVTGEVRRLVEGAARPCPDPPDRTPPRLLVARKFRQHVEPHRSLFVTAGCDERCRVAARARIRLPGRDEPFEAVATASLAANHGAEMRILLSPQAGRAVRRALDAGHEVTARLRVTARDQAGNSAVKRRRVLVLR